MATCDELEALLIDLDSKVAGLQPLFTNRLTVLERLIQQLTGRKPEERRDNTQSRLASLEQRLARLEAQGKGENKPENLKSRVLALENWANEVANIVDQISDTLRYCLESLDILNNSTEELSEQEKKLIQAFKTLTKDQLKGKK
jgi:chromosome segregation ATPase